MVLHRLHLRLHPAARSRPVAVPLDFVALCVEQRARQPGVAKRALPPSAASRVAATSAACVPHACTRLHLRLHLRDLLCLRLRLRQRIARRLRLRLRAPLRSRAAFAARAM